MLESMLSTYGYPVLLAGTLLEGQAILFMAGLAAHMGYLDLKWVILIGMIGSMLGDQIYFYLGRRHGKALLDRRPWWRSKTATVLERLERHQTAIVLGFPFLYGLRSITPFAIGLTTIPYRRFLLLNFIGVAAWATTISLAGYFGGQAIEAVLGDIRRYEIEVMIAVAVLAIAFWLPRRFRQRQRGRAA